MAGIINRLGLQLKRPLIDPFWIGEHIIKDREREALVATPLDFSNNIKENVYPKRLNDTFNKALEKYDNDFFIEVTFERDKVHPEAYRLVFNSRTTCPIPFWNRHVYYFNKKNGTLELLWAIPDRFLCNHPEYIPLGVQNKSELMDNISKFKSGFYLNIFKKLNNIKED